MERIKRLTKTPHGIALLAGVAILTGLALATVYVFMVSPAAIRYPKMEHAHFRMQLIANGEAINFAEDTYQETYKKGVCSGDLTKSPIHFHDSKNQFVHLHWQGMTGGMVLKNYGWNFTGGPDNILGYRLDEFPKITPVPIHTDSLPGSTKDLTLWVYIGTAESYKLLSQEDFINKDMEAFFGKKSTINSETASIFDILFPRAYAHDGGHDATSTDEHPSEDELKSINNLLGDVVIFAQNDKPTDAEIKKQFLELEPLTDSTCGG